MSRRMAGAVAVVLAVGACGCASTSSMQVSRVSRRAASADTAQWHDVASLPQPSMSATRVALKPMPTKTVAHGEAHEAHAVHEAPRDAPPPLAVLATEAAEPPAQSSADDPFDTMFTGAGRVEEAGDSVGGGGRNTSRTPAPAASSPVTPRVAAPLAGAPGSTHPAVVAPLGGARGSSPPPLMDSAPADEAPQSGRAYAVQLHAFPTRPAAEFAARQAGRILGVATRVHGVSTSSLPFKVLAGHFVTRAAATELRERAVHGGFPEAWVVADPDAVRH